MLRVLKNPKAWRWLAALSFAVGLVVVVTAEGPAVWLAIPFVASVVAWRIEFLLDPKHFWEHHAGE